MESAFSNPLDKQNFANNDYLQENLLLKNIQKSTDLKDNVINSVLEVKQYDESCEDFSKIEKVIVLNYCKKKLILFLMINVFTAFLINLLIIWYPELKFYFIYTEADIKDGKFIAIYGLGKNNIFTSQNLLN